MYNPRVLYLIDRCCFYYSICNFLEALLKALFICIIYILLHTCTCIQKEKFNSKSTPEASTECIVWRLMLPLDLCVNNLFSYTSLQVWWPIKLVYLCICRSLMWWRPCVHLNWLLHTNYVLHMHCRCESKPGKETQSMGLFKNFVYRRKEVVFRENIGWPAQLIS